MLAGEFYLNDFRDVKEALIVQNFFNIFLIVFAQLFRSDLPSLFVFFLEFLKL